MPFIAQKTVFTNSGHLITIALSKNIGTMRIADTDESEDSSYYMPLVTKEDLVKLRNAIDEVIKKANQ